MAFSIDHVQIAIPIGGEEKARAFFGELLGLAEIAKPHDMAKRGGCWFKVADLQLHVGVEKEFRPARKAHVALRTDALDTMRDSMELAGYETFDDTKIDGRHRFFSHDPFGNRIEFMDKVARS